MAQFFFSPEENKRGDDMSKSFEVSEKLRFTKEAYLERSQATKIKLLLKIVNSFQSLTISTKGSILDVWLVSKCPFMQYLKTLITLK